MKQTRRILALLLALCLSWSQVSPALAAALEDGQTEPVVVVEETVAPEVVETEAAAEETEAPEVVETEAAEEEVVAEDAEAAAGDSAENPVSIGEGTDSVTVTVPANTTMYFSGYFYGQSLVINGVVEEIYLLTYEEEYVFSITNDTAEEKTYTIERPYPKGSSGNPYDLTLGEDNVEFTADGLEGYNYNWTAPADGILSVSVTPNVADWGFAVMVFAGGAPDIHRYGIASDNPDVTNAHIRVLKGNQVTLMVYTTMDSAERSGSMAFKTSFREEAPGPGSYPDNPLVLDTTKLVWDENGISARMTVTAPVGTTWYRINITGMDISVNGMPAFNKGIDEDYQFFRITNNGLTDAEYEIVLTYPVGDPSNPELLTMGEHTVRIAPGNWMGHTYYMIAPSDGELTITVDPSAPVWKYSVHGYELEGFTHSSADETIVTSDTVSVTAGSRVHVTFTTRMDDEMDTPHAAINFTASFTSTVPGATAENPIYLNDDALWTWNEKNTAATMTVTAPVGTTWYSLLDDSMVISVNGVPVSGQLYTGNPQVFSITNDGEAEAE